MGQWKFHTPNGVTDLLPAGCRNKRQIEQSVRLMFEQRGYQEIERKLRSLGAEMTALGKGEGS